MEESSNPSLVDKDVTICYDYNLTAQDEDYYSYFLELYCFSPTDTLDYSVKVCTPDAPDAYETHGTFTNNNSYTRSVDISELTSPLTGLTLHQGDKDYYKFTTGTGGATVSITMSTVDLCTDPYIMTLEDDGTGLWEATEDGADYVINATLAANETHYIKINRHSPYLSITLPK